MKSGTTWKSHSSMDWPVNVQSQSASFMVLLEHIKPYDLQNNPYGIDSSIHFPPPIQARPKNRLKRMLSFQLFCILRLL